MMNFLIVGCLVLFVHDPGDVSLVLARGNADFKYKTKVLSIILPIFVLLTWVYLRVIIFPQCIIYSLYDYLMNNGHD